jgi:hypothetical protein
LGYTQTAEDLIEVPMTPAIRQIGGSSNNEWLSHIHFKSKNGQFIQKMEYFKSGNRANDQLLADGEEIIGIYGTKDQDAPGYWSSLGFIVWLPPKF